MVSASSERQPVEISCVPYVGEESALEGLIKHRGAGVLPLASMEQESFSNAIDEKQIPQIVIHHSNIPKDDMPQFGQNDIEQYEPEVTEATQPPVEKKGAMHALRR